MAARALARASRRLAALPQVAVETHAASSLAALSTSGVGAHTVTSALQPIFAPPSRGIASSPITTGLPSDKIHMRGLVFYAYHGVYPEEEKLGQRFVVDVTMGVDLRTAGHSDDLQHSVDYGTVYLLVKEVVEGKGRRRQLIEAVAHDIASEVLGHSSKIGSVAVTVKKPHVAVPGQVDYLGVEIFRTRECMGRR